MPGWLKVLLIILVIGILFVVGVIAAGGIWFYRNKEVLKAKLDNITTEARDVGKSTDNQGCVNETISRYKAEPGITSAMSNAIFVACVSTQVARHRASVTACRSRGSSPGRRNGGKSNANAPALRVTVIARVSSPPFNNSAT